MAPKSPWNNKATTRRNDVAPAKAKPSAGGATESAPIDYGQVQEEEIEVLQAIYMDDYEEVETRSAWSKATDRAFKLKIKSFTDEDTAVTLSVRLTATYPKSPPLLQVLDGLDRLQAGTQQRINRILQEKPKELSGEVMIHAIASDIQEALEDAVQARERNVLSSLEEERVVNETAATTLAKKEEDQEAKRAKEAQAEEDRMLQQMVNEEVERREAKRRSKPPRKAPDSSSDGAQDDSTKIHFDQSIALASGDIPFCDVFLISTIHRDPGMTLSSSTPRLGIQPERQPVLAVRRVELAIAATDASKSELLALEEELEALKALRQPNISNIYAFRMDKSELEARTGNQRWHITILSDYANRGSLAELLEDGQTISLPKARSWSLELLEALDFYHRNGIIHKRIHTRNVIMYRSSSGMWVPKLADAAYQQRIHGLQGGSSSPQSEKRPWPWAAPETVAEPSQFVRKSDVWDFGALFAQMLLGSGVVRKHNSPISMINSLPLSDALEDMLRKIFVDEARKRPSAFDLIPSDFLRNDIPVLGVETSATRRRRPSSSLAFSGYKSPLLRRSRTNSMSTGETASRYMNDFTELGRLGKGGFGEVVKARNKLDGGVYAIKKMKQDTTAQLEQVLSEVMLLHRLNHPYVVRYYSAWVEDDLTGHVELDESVASMTDGMTASSTAEDGPQIEFGMSSRGLDFVSSSGVDHDFIQFGDDDDEEEEEEEEEDVDANSEYAANTDSSINGVRPPALRRGNTTDTITEEAVDDSIDLDPDEIQLKKARSASRRIVRSTLYIQMEYCERQTLRDLIRKGLPERIQESWQMLRQILEGLVHIHGHGIIHRDLKPDNIFIDVTGNPRIGDFGLATTNQYFAADKAVLNSNAGGDMTRSVGTTLYVAPELRTGTGTTYNDKVDMYSLGIIFFEMCFSLPTVMERHEVLRQLREKEHTLPSEFQKPEKSSQGDIINLLVSHTPSERPSSAELLRSDKLPLQVEDETIRQALRSLSDSNSPYYQALFTQNPDRRVKDLAWDVKSAGKPALTAADLRMRDVARQALTSIFRRHGAEEVQRPLLLPRSAYYTNVEVALLLDRNGNLLQLPYDLTLPFARQLARLTPSVEKSFVFGHVYRDIPGAPPRTYGEVDFDIVSITDDDSLVLKEAEVIKVADEIIDDLPALSSTSMCFHLNHSDLLDIILDYCRVDMSQRPAVKEVLSRLNHGQHTWQKVRAQLRSPHLGIHSTSLDDMAQFDFRETPEKILAKLQSVLEGTSYLTRMRRPLEHLRQLVDAIKLFNVRRKIYICPLSSFNEKFYTGGVLFQCIHDRKNRGVFAAGGRYDRLIDAHHQRAQSTLSQCRHAVGISIAWDLLISTMLRHQKAAATSSFTKKGAEEPTAAPIAKRCDALIVSSDPSILRTTGVKLLATLWSADISAELASDTRSIDELLSRQRDANHSFIIVIKPFEAASGIVKVRNTHSDTESEVASTGLVSHIRSELRERDQHHSNRPQRHYHPALQRHTSYPDAREDRERRGGNVQVLLSQHRSKKSNKYHIVEAAQSRWAEKVDSFKNAPILAVETRDDVLDAIRETRLSDPDSWRKVVQSVQLAERQYLSQVHDWLGEISKKWNERESGREVCVFNFRTGSCIYYDVSL